MLGGIEESKKSRYGGNVAWMETKDGMTEREGVRMEGKEGKDGRGKMEASRRRQEGIEESKKSRKRRD